MKFSVCMCVYNGDHPIFFNDALISIKNQTLPPDEIVLVVDGPINSQLDEVISSFDFKSFVVVRLSTNVGLGEARRIGVDRTRNELVALMDSDDVSSKDRFFRQIEVFKKMNVDVVGALISEFSEDIQEPETIRQVPEFNSEIKNTLGLKCPVNHVSVMFKKRKYYEAGGYLDWHYNEDYYLWIRLFDVDAKFYNIQEPLVYVRVDENMYKRRGGWKYFRSEFGIQVILLKSKYIRFVRFMLNILIRFIVQVLMTNNQRISFFKKYTRKKVNNEK